MDSSRLEAFSDGFFAVIITIMVLELMPPAGAGWAALRGSMPGVLIYALSFAYLGIYWSNHHHFYQLVERVDGGVLWANLHLMFWLSLVPFATAWMGRHAGAVAPTAMYGAALFLPALAWWLMRTAVLHAHARGSHLAAVMRSGWKENLSLALYAAGIALSLWRPYAADALYILVALLWMIPDRRVEHALGKGKA
ncbi:MAG: TMEM175 family protein [Terriglobales bacterium]